MASGPKYNPPTVKVRKRMQAVRRVNTEPELALRSALHALGLRFRVDVPLLVEVPRRRVDVAFPAARVACFVHGCFWHSCRWHGSSPKRNAAYWRDKIRKNVARDHDTKARLTRAGWHVVTCWAHDDPMTSAARIKKVIAVRLRQVCAIGKRRGSPSRRI